jgi:hypothetical protein
MSDATPAPLRRLTVTSDRYADARLAAHAAARDSDGYLTVSRDGETVAQFAPGQWAAVVDEAHRAPDWLAAARDGLDRIMHAIRAVPGARDDDLVQRVYAIADEARAASYPGQEPPF